MKKLTNRQSRVFCQKPQFCCRLGVSNQETFGKQGVDSFGGTPFFCGKKSNCLLIKILCLASSDSTNAISLNFQLTDSTISDGIQHYRSCILLEAVFRDKRRAYRATTCIFSSGCVGGSSKGKLSDLWPGGFVSMQVCV